MGRQIVQAKVEGWPQLKAILTDLFPEAITEQATVAALKQVVRPVISDAKTLVGTGAGKESKRASWRAKGRLLHIRDTIRAVQARMRAGKRYIKIGGSILVGAFHPLAHLKEYGTAPRHQAGGRYTGAMPATPFMRPAWRKNEGRVFEDLGPLIWQNIQRAAKRLSRRADKLGAQRG